jgi:transcriptional regulator with XRE-family HTH domain
MQDIGTQLRRVRRDRGWTLDVLAARSGLSTGFLSLVERGQSTLSIVSLSAICRALEYPMEVLFTSSGPLLAGAARVTKAARQLRIQIGDSDVSYRYLTPQLPAAPIEELLIAEFPAGASQEATPHDGEELGYVLWGRLTLCAGGEEHRLAPGDSYRISPRETHVYRAGGSGARVLMAVTQRFIEPTSTPRRPGPGRRAAADVDRAAAGKGARRGAH